VSVVKKSGADVGTNSTPSCFKLAHLTGRCLLRLFLLLLLLRLGGGRLLLLRDRVACAQRIHIDAFAINPGGGRGLCGGDAAAHDQRYQRERHCPHRSTP